jgi:hypothetical protein
MKTTKKVTKKEVAPKVDMNFINTFSNLGLSFMGNSISDC